MKYTRSLVVLMASCLMGSVDVRAHHSGSEYAQTTVEIEGTLLEVAWQNPHVHFFVRAKDEKGTLVTWDIEANSLSILSRTDATPENLGPRQRDDEEPDDGRAASAVEWHRSGSRDTALGAVRIAASRQRTNRADNALENDSRRPALSRRAAACDDMS